MIRRKVQAMTAPRVTCRICRKRRHSEIFRSCHVCMTAPLDALMRKLQRRLKGMKVEFSPGWLEGTFAPPLAHLIPRSASPVARSRGRRRPTGAKADRRK